MKSGGATGMAGTDTAPLTLVTGRGSPPTACGSARELGGDEVGHRLSGRQELCNAITYDTEGDNKSPATIPRYCCVGGRSVVWVAGLLYPLPMIVER